jgi:hypothetical protein
MLQLQETSKVSMNCPEAEITRLMLRLGFPVMPEASAAGRNRWYRVKWPDQRNLSPARAEKYFDNDTEAFDYFQRRLAGHPTGRVHRPVQSHEKPTVWAVCVDPV